MLEGVRTLCGDPALAAGSPSSSPTTRCASGQRSVDQTLERLWVNVGFVDRERGELAERRSPVADASAT